MLSFIASLDTFTLKVTAALVMVLTSLASLMLWLTLPERHTRLWTGGALLVLAGLIAGALREQVPQLVAIPVGNALVGMGGTMFSNGVARFCRDSAREWPVTAIGAGAFLLFCAFTYLYPSLSIRVALISLLYLLLCLRMAWMLWRHADPGIRIAQRATAVLIALEIGYYGLGLSGMLVPSGAQRFEAAPAALNAVYLNAIILFTCLIFAFAALTNRRLQLRLQHTARHDPLTGCLNRLALEEGAAREIARCRRRRQPLSLIALDLDHFKQINDLHGHQVGDEALRRFARTLRQRLRGEDLFGRLGGEEFCVLLPGADADTAALVAERLRVAVETLLIPAGPAALALTVSAGTATAEAGSEADWNALLKAADVALYAAKAGGRNRVAAALPTAPVGA